MLQMLFPTRNNIKKELWDMFHKYYSINPIHFELLDKYSELYLPAEISP